MKVKKSEVNNETEFGYLNVGDLFITDEYPDRLFMKVSYTITTEYINDDHKYINAVDNYGHCYAFDATLKCKRAVIYNPNGSNELLYTTEV
jgi:hypothetical protein